MNVHFIAIGGAVMHNLAIALKNKGYQVTGSDDNVFDPSRSRLAKHGLLPATFGWFPERVHGTLDAVIVGMHARADNPELLKAKELGIKTYSFPEFLYEVSKNKKRVAIGGSHGKTTITSMVMHVLKYHDLKFDYMVGASIAGFETMVGFSEDAEIAIFEGDEYLASPLDPRPKFHIYKPHIGLISGIAWDHINVFPTFENYVSQFHTFARCIEPGGTLVYCQHDALACEVAEMAPDGIQVQAYRSHPNQIIDNQTVLHTNKGQTVPIGVFGEHNLQNISAAKAVCNQLDITDYAFYEAIGSFSGAAKRLQKVYETTDNVVFTDFAHSPSKVKATVSAVKQQYPSRKLVACLELHTFSSLTKAFLAQYNKCLHDADVAVVFFSPDTIAHKKMEQLSHAEVKEAFGLSGVVILNQTDQLQEYLKSEFRLDCNILLMSSGNFGGLQLGAQVWE